MREGQYDWVNNVLMDIAKFLNQNGLIASSESVMGVILTFQSEQKTQIENEREKVEQCMKGKKPN